ncbi:HdeD family acid-resistance protein [Dyadobacter flavalbus]|uniref:HdeD family acid-resistance protein n=1 Tax=Dyadobacter flavalbus TaxID=2579942 RepID=A0A5M8R446_9BACT|nr:DUF308 domain-containing protein [Dyadobacter flavalbus]KAA6440912.1 HdeD family acid-resistance protein [Dyadobacter flavalbus]
MENSSLKQYYFYLFLGIILSGIGIWILIKPIDPYNTLSNLLMTSFVVIGILEIFYSIFNRREIDNWGWSLASGTVSLLIGALLFAHPMVTMTILPVYVGFGIFFRSIMAVSWSFNLKSKKVENWSYLLSLSILGVIFSFIIILNPVLRGITVIFYTGLAFMIIGITNIYLAIRLKKDQQTSGIIFKSKRLK